VIEPIRLQFEVSCTPDRAFSTWTERIGTWWPDDHTVTGEVGLSVVLEGRSGGRIFERTAGGIEHDWGEVTAWDPPHRIVYLWHLRRDRADATEVEIRFVGLEQGRTRVDIEHRGWDRLGVDGESWRDRNCRGWATLLPHFVKASAGAR
jgi:uncharacterized protein YndB with AHSA1/START domain